MSGQKAAWHDTWASVDETNDPGWFVEFLDVTREGLLAQATANPMSVHGHLEPVPGKVMLDIGCGTGSLLASLAQLVAPDGQVVGVDSSKVMIDEAKRRAESSKLPLEFEVMDAMNLQFADHTFDATTATIVLEHLPDPAKAFKEAVRVTAPGGIVSIIDQDLGGTLIDVADRAVGQKVADMFARSVRHPWMGRQLYAMFMRAGMKDVKVNPVSMPMRGKAAQSSVPLFDETVKRAVKAKVITQDEGDAFRAEIERRIVDETAFVHMTVFRATGRKP